MSGERAGSSGGTDLEIGGFGLVLGTVAVVALCVLSFFLGRWSVGFVAPAGAGAANPAVEDAGDVEAELTFFDRLEKAPELSAQGDERTVRPLEAAPTGPAEAPPDATAAPPSADGKFEVQVLAVAERSAAEAVVARLRLKGYPARLLEGEKGGAPLYRVRVGGFADEESARGAATAIEREEGLRTWVVR